MEDTIISIYFLSYYYWQHWNVILRVLFKSTLNKQIFFLANTEIQPSIFAISFCSAIFPDGNTHVRQGTQPILQIYMFFLAFPCNINRVRNQVRLGFLFSSRNLWSNGVIDWFIKDFGIWLLFRTGCCCSLFWLGFVWIMTIIVWPKRNKGQHYFWYSIIFLIENLPFLSFNYL